MSKKPDDASKIAGLASILQAGNKQKEIPPSPALPPDAPVDVPLPPARRAKVGKVGKYRDPNFHHYGVYLRMDTHKRVKRRLEDTEAGKDLSELVQELLEQWLKSD
jgi:hypothetical protein